MRAEHGAAGMSDGVLHKREHPRTGHTAGACSRRKGMTRRNIRPVLVTLLVVGLAGCEWFSDFKRQPSVVTWESWSADSLVVRGSPQGSVPVTGSAVPAFEISYAATAATIDSFANIPNPVEPTEASLARGHVFYQINCAVCHGDTGKGDGLATRYGVVPIALTSESAEGRTAGYIFGIIRNGRGFMPSYNRIEERDRWDVVNYLMALQGRITGIPFATGPLAKPGVNGDKVPGASEIGPTRAIPYRAVSTVPPGDGR